MENDDNVKYNIAMCSDFFYPQIGGVEFHMYHLSQKLINKGHNVIIITHNYGERMNIRFLTNGLKIYYLPYLVVARQTSFPTIFASLPVMRQIFIRENINIIHSHGSVSTISHEALIHGAMMDIPTLLTDHSLYPFNSLSHILVNKLLRFSTTLTNKLIAVSQTTKENLCIRSGRHPSDCFVIPNAVVADDFKPVPLNELAQNERYNDVESITVVVISRLFENKGIKLLIQVIPELCEKNKNLNFIIAGDGPMFIDLQQMIELNKLEDRIELMGSIPHEKVRDVMIKGDIYLHCSLIEAFGTVLVEAASSGLLIVTTTVGGILEVLPDHMAVYCHDLSSQCIIEGVLKGIKKWKELKKKDLLNFNNNNKEEGLVRNLPFQWRFHNEIKNLYNWENVADRTLKVYYQATKQQKDEKLNMLEKIVTYYMKKVDNDDGFFSRLLYALCCTVNLIYLLFLDKVWDPRENIEKAVKWNRFSLDE
ncbi:hypothetical protein ACO0SA_000124 [Hanseniaspora valbyensis]